MTKREQQTAEIRKAIERRKREKESDEAERWLNEHMKWKPCGYEW